MKFLYQQLLAFWALIMVVLLIVGFSFFSFTKNSLEDSNYSQLFNYAQSILKNSQNSMQKLGDKLRVSEYVLTDQQVRFYLVDADKTVLYPSSDSNGEAITLKISAADWKEVSGADASTTNNKGYLSNTRTTNLVGDLIPTSYIMLPIYYQQTDGPVFAGAIIVSQPSENVQKAMIPFTENLIKGFIISSFVAILISYFLAQYQVKRINRLKNVTKEITKGNFDVQIATKDKHNDEFDELGDDFNQMARSLKDYRNEVHEQEERRTQFMADASHEMRTPLTTINGLLEGLNHGAIPEARKEKAFKLMENETKRLIRLVNENLDYEKIRTNQISMMVKEFSGNEAMENLITQMSGKAEKAGDTLTFNETEQVTIIADYDRFVQVLVNVIQNAIQFTTNGSITLGLRNVDGGAEVTVADTGIGMTEEEQKNIWDRYYKVDPSRKNTKFGESGLGLPIVQQIMRLHGGSITLRSQKDVGTTFILFFPNKEPKELPDAKNPAEN